MPRAASLALLAFLSACDLFGGGGADANPPAEPPPDDRLDEVLAGLPTTDDGLPILSSVHAFGSRVEIVHDGTKDDAISRWGQCVSRVADCHRSNPGARIAGCIEQIERCPDDTGGRDCCPPRCIQEFLDRYGETGDEEGAIEATILAGTCVEGFPADEVSP